MQIQRDTGALGADQLPGVARNADATTSPSTTAAASPPSVSAPPLTGGRRTVSPAVFDEVDLTAEARAIPQSLSSFTEIVAERTRQFALKLTDLFKGLGVDLSEPITMSISSYGKVTVSGSDKAVIEQMFEDNPRLVEQLKELMTLQAMLATKIALDEHAKAMREAKTDDERDAADNALMSDLASIKALRDTMILSDGGLTSAALASINDRYGAD